MKKQWCIPEEVSAEFVWRMEDVLEQDVLELYEEPYDPNRQTSSVL